MKWIIDKIRRLERYAAKPWYPALLGLLSFLYHFLLIIPVDVLFLSSSLIVPKRWVAIFIATTVGFTLGGTAFAYLVHLYGPSLVEQVVPGIMQNPIWHQSEIWMQKYGALAVGGISLIPFSLHPLVALAGLHNMPVLVIAASIFTGRFIKYGILGWLCAHLPSKVPLPKSAAELIRPTPETDAK